MPCPVSQRWWHFERIVAHRLNESFAFGFVRFIGAVVLAVAPARHAYARTITACELLLRAASEFEDGGVGAGKRARLGVVVDCPPVHPDQQRACFCIRGCQKLLVLLIVSLPQGEICVIPESTKLLSNYHISLPESDKVKVVSKC